MVNSPRAGSRAEVASLRGVCAMSDGENNPVAPNAAAPRMKFRLQISHIAPPGRIGISPTANGGLWFATGCVRLLKRIVTPIGGRDDPPRHPHGPPTVTNLLS